jgi:exopolysaccharide biosynthesis polyprenyl glycosylphosphotransferase
VTKQHGLRAGLFRQRSPRPKQRGLLMTERLPHDALRRRILALADTGAVLLAAGAVGLWPMHHADAAVWSLVFLPVWILLAKLHGLYDRDHRALRHLTVDEVPEIFIWALTGTASVALLLHLTPAGSLSIPEAALLWLITGLGATVLRGFGRGVWRRLTPPERVVVVGEGPLAAETRRKLELFPDIHARIVTSTPPQPSELLDAPEQVEAADRLIVASPSVDERTIARLVELCRAKQLKLSVVPPVRGMFGTAVQLIHVADLPIVEYNTWDVSRSTLLLKRAIDLVVSVTALLVLGPILILIACAIKLDSHGPVLFVQQRAGVRGKPFKMLKFRTMVADAEDRLDEVVELEELPDPMFKLDDDPRVTRMGGFLRRASLDEFPQLVNVLKGDMSLVGPRPEQVELVERYAPEHRFRLAVRPGMTGPMQVFGRGRLTFQERLAVEREYIENLSIGRDLRILALTVGAVVSGRGAY